MVDGLGGSVLNESRLSPIGNLVASGFTSSTSDVDTNSLAGLEWSSDLTDRLNGLCGDTLSDSRPLVVRSSSCSTWWFFDPVEGPGGSLTRDSSSGVGEAGGLGGNASSKSRSSS